VPLLATRLTLNRLFHNDDDYSFLLGYIACPALSPHLSSVSSMLGPRTMDVGTSVAPPLAGASFDAQYPPPLTPAQRLIERYERLNTPPPHTPPPYQAVSRKKINV
jgi:hypothetical protein